MFHSPRRHTCEYFGSGASPDVCAGSGGGFKREGESLGREKGRGRNKRGTGSSWVPRRKTELSDQTEKFFMKYIYFSVLYLENRPKKVNRINVTVSSSNDALVIR